MKLCRTELQQGVALNTVTTDRFKTAFFTVNLFVPLEKETASASLGESLAYPLSEVAGDDPAGSSVERLF